MIIGENIYITGNCNFSLVFNTSSLSFAVQSLAPEWSLQEAKDYLKENNIEDKVDYLWKLNKDKQDSDITKELCYFWAVASDIKKTFFEMYPGVKKWIDNQIKFAKSNGYVTSIFGAIRRLPQLLLIDENEHSSSIKNLENIACNSPVQNYEVVLINKTIFKLSQFIKENNFKTKLVGNVHDSIVLYIHRDEIMTILKKAKEIFEEDIPENKGIPLELECELADPTKGQMWGYGEEVKVDMAV